MFYVFARYRYPLVPFLLLFAAAAVGVTSRSVRCAIARAGSRRCARCGGSRRGWRCRELAAAVADADAGDHREQPRHRAAGTAALRRGDRASPARDRARARLRAGLQQPWRGAARRRPRSTKRSPSIGRRSRSSPTSPAPATTSPTRCWRRARPARRSNSSARRWQSTPDSVEAHNNLGIALAAKGDAAGAIAEFRAALAIDDRSVHAHRNLGNMLIDAGAARRGHGAPRARDRSWRRTSPTRSTTSARVLLRGSEFRRRRPRASRRR